jgi:hypothetical protein
MFEEIKKASQYSDWLFLLLKSAVIFAMIAR